MSAQNDNQMNYNSAKYDNLHQRLHMLILDMQDELNDYSARLEELKAMVVLAEAQRGTLDGAVYDEEQLNELRRMIDKVAAASAQRAKAMSSYSSYSKLCLRNSSPRWMTKKQRKRPL